MGYLPACRRNALPPEVHPSDELTQQLCFFEKRTILLFRFCIVRSINLRNIISDLEREFFKRIEKES